MLAFLLFSPATVAAVFLFFVLRNWSRDPEVMYSVMNTSCRGGHMTVTRRSHAGHMTVT